MNLSNNQFTMATGSDYRVRRQYYWQVRLSAASAGGGGVSSEPHLVHVSHVERS